MPVEAVRSPVKRRRGCRNRSVWSPELADLVARGELEVPIAGVFALDDVREAYRQLELRHTRGKLGCDREWRRHR